MHRNRDSLFLMAPLRVLGDAEEREVRVRNLSPGGLMIEFRKILAVGTKVSLELRGIGTVDGRVAWCTEGRIGVALDETIDPRAARKPVGVAPRAPFFTRPPGEA